MKITVLKRKGKINVIQENSSHVKGQRRNRLMFERSLGLKTIKLSKGLFRLLKVNWVLKFYITDSYTYWLQCYRLICTVIQNNGHLKTLPIPVSS